MLDGNAQNIHDVNLMTRNPAKMTRYNLTPVMLSNLQSARADTNLENLLHRLIPQFVTARREFTEACAAARKSWPPEPAKPAQPAKAQQLQKPQT